MSLKKNLRASLAKNENGDKVIQIEFPYDLDLLMKVRSLPGRKYHPAERCWSAPYYSDTIQMLKGWGFIFDKPLRRFLERKEFKASKIAQEGVPGLRGVLRPFQTLGVLRYDKNNGKILNADEMGLGKTIQTLAWLQLHPENRPVIIVVQASLKLNWAKEALTWMSKPKIEILVGNTPWKVKGEIIIINYDILPAWVKELRKIKAKVIVFDEAQYIKNNKAKRTKASKQLVKSGIPHVIGLTGTPIENRPIEIYNIVYMINKTLFPNYLYFTEKYCDRKNNGFGWDVSGHSNEMELHDLLVNSIMLRRLKADVLPELPPKVRSFVPLQLCNNEEYRAAEDDLLAFIRQTKGKEAAERMSLAEALVKWEVLKQLHAKGILPSAIEWIHDFLSSDQKLVIFATHHFVIDTLMKEFGKIAVKIDGTVSLPDRQRAIEEFQHNNRIKLFVGQIKASGVGITLTAASNVVFLELPWTPGELAQAIARLDRIGQLNSVNIYFLLAVNSIMEEVAQMLDEKQQIVTAVTDGMVVDRKTLITELIKRYEQKNGRH
jgi:SWI/SNF-related matrix-associated actin-dependent regulator of chromatin subfamily A-like protein 1